MNNLYNVMTKKTKGKLVNFRIREGLKRDVEIAAQMRETTLSGLIHQLLVKAIREEKERDPKGFAEMQQEFIKSVEAENITQTPVPYVPEKDEGMLDDEHAPKTQKRKRA